MASKRSFWLAIISVVLACGDDTAAPTVEPPPPRCPQGLSVTPASANLRVGDTLRGQVAMWSACSTLTDTRVRWSSTNPLVVVVDSVSGLLTAKSLGTATAVARVVALPHWAAGLQVSVVP